MEPTYADKLDQMCRENIPDAIPIMSHLARVKRRFWYFGREPEQFSINLTDTHIKLGS